MRDNAGMWLTGLFTFAGALLLLWAVQARSEQKSPPRGDAPSATPANRPAPLEYRPTRTV